MKKLNPLQKALLCFLTLALLSLCVSCAKGPPETIHNIAYTAIGTPSGEAYPDGGIARSPWDMILYDDCLFVGSGDYDKNAGPVPIYCYSTKSGEWTESERLAEEEINRFLLLDGTLATPGIDPREDWSLGNYYTLEKGKWVKHRTLPDGVHAYDMIRFEGAIYAGLGVTSGKMPVMRSFDGGESFEPIDFLKDAAVVKTEGFTYIRTYDLLEFDGKLYATLTLGNESLSYELYEYDDTLDAFIFFSDLKDSVVRVKYNHMRITATAKADDTVFLVTGKLYETRDMDDFYEITLDGVDLVCDIYEDDGKIYFLTATKANDEEGVFKTSVWQVWKDKEGEMSFVELFNLYYDVPCLSLAVENEDFYIGMSDTTAKNELNGTVLHVEYSY